MDTDPNRWIDRYPKVDQDYGRVTRLEAEIKELQSRIKTLEDNSEAEYTSKITTWAESLGCVQDREARCDSETEPDAEPPYRMVEPTNIGAVVMGAWFDALFTRFDRELNPWVSLRTGCVYEWVDIPDPQPYQNCTLTADDPEPPVDSSVRSPEGVVSVRWPSGWSDIGLPRGQRFGWDEVTETPVTLLYRGEEDTHSSGLKWTEMHDDSAE